MKNRDQGYVWEELFLDLFWVFLENPCQIMFGPFNTKPKAKFEARTILCTETIKVQNPLSKNPKIRNPKQSVE
jgi:hypothetical protein